MELGVLKGALGFPIVTAAPTAGWQGIRRSRVTA